MIKIYSGETLIMPININSKDITDLSGATLKFVAKHRDNPNIEIVKTPTVNGMVVTTELTSKETLTEGVYFLELRGRFSGITKVVQFETLLITHANIREELTDG